MMTLELTKLGGYAMWRTLVGAGVLVVRDRCVLLVARTRDGLTRWELPSGLTEAGESLEETAVREALEETGIAVAVGLLLCTVVINVPDAEYRAINAYFLANALDDRLPGIDLAIDEPIYRAEYIDLASLSLDDVHPVDWGIVMHWTQHPDQIPFHLTITL
jgi:8-oxo-dGTP diphosphatase